MDGRGARPFEDSFPYRRYHHHHHPTKHARTTYLISPASVRIVRHCHPRYPVQAVARNRAPITVGWMKAKVRPSRTPSSPPLAAASCALKSKGRRSPAAAGAASGTLLREEGKESRPSLLMMPGMRGAKDSYSCFRGGGSLRRDVCGWLTR